MHTSVLLRELLDLFKGQKIRIFVDATLGAGGHSEAFLTEHPEIELLIGIDQDPTARAIAEKRLSKWKNKIKIIPSNFSNLKTILSDLNIPSIDGIIFDLGVSSMQFDQAEKGFSFMRDGPLDMRMNPDNPLTAAVIINTWEERDLARIFRDYGEEKRWRAAARAITQARKEAPIETTFQLVEALKPAFPGYYKKGLHPATLVFQALRIAVNDELRVIENTLPVAIEALASGGRVGVISFHSLEDRIVKTITRDAASDKVNTSGIGGLFLDKDPTIKILTKKPIVPSDQEIEENPRSRSAKLRVVEKI